MKRVLLFFGYVSCLQSAEMDKNSTLLPWTHEAIEMQTKIADALNKSDDFYTFVDRDDSIRALFFFTGMTGIPSLFIPDNFLLKCFQLAFVSTSAGSVTGHIVATCIEECTHPIITAKDDNLVQVDDIKQAYLSSNKKRTIRSLIANGLIPAVAAVGLAATAAYQTDEYSNLAFKCPAIGFGVNAAANTFYILLKNRHVKNAVTHMSL